LNEKENPYNQVQAFSNGIEKEVTKGSLIKELNSGILNGDNTCGYSLRLTNIQNKIKTKRIATCGMKRYGKLTKMQTAESVLPSNLRLSNRGIVRGGSSYMKREKIKQQKDMAERWQLSQ